MSCSVVLILDAICLFWHGFTCLWCIQCFLHCSMLCSIFAFINTFHHFPWFVTMSIILNLWFKKEKVHFWYAGYNRLWQSYNGLKMLLYSAWLVAIIWLKRRLVHSRFHPSSVHNINIKNLNYGTENIWLISHL